MEKKSFKFKDNELYLVVGSYRNNDRIFIGCETKEDIYSDFTINLDLEIEDYNYAFIDALATDVGLVDKMEELGIVENRYGVCQYNMGRYEYVSLNFEKIKEYDINGFNEFMKANELDDISPKI